MIPRAQEASALLIYQVNNTENKLIQGTEDVELNSNKKLKQASRVRMIQGSHISLLSTMQQ